MAFPDRFRGRVIDYLKRVTSAPAGWEVEYTEDFIREKVDELVQNLLEDERIKNGGTVRMVQVLKSAQATAAMVKKGLEDNGVKVELYDVNASSYRDGTRGNLTIEWGEKKLEVEKNDVVLIVDDMLDSGFTMLALLMELKKEFESTASVMAVVLLKKFGAIMSSDDSRVEEEMPSLFTRDIKDEDERKFVTRVSPNDYLSAIDVENKEDNRWVAGGCYVDENGNKVVGINGNQWFELLGSKDGRLIRDIISRTVPSLSRSMDILWRTGLGGQFLLKFFLKVLEIGYIKTEDIDDMINESS